MPWLAMKFLFWSNPSNFKSYFDSVKSKIVLVNSYYWRVMLNSTQKSKLKLSLATYNGMKVLKEDNDKEN